MFIISLIIGGLIIGALARLLLPGRDPMGILMTILVGIGGSLLGGLVGKALFGRPGGFILALICSVLIVYIIRRTRGPGRVM
jgi:uncharacterized membrane protein YeaQ/YmgE (transglycosylase-associated protein family)